MSTVVSLLLAFLPHAMLVLYACVVRLLTPCGISLSNAYLSMIPMAVIFFGSMLGIGLVTSAIDPDNYLLWASTLLIANVFSVALVWRHAYR